MGLFGIHRNKSCDLKKIVEYVEKQNEKALCKILKSKKGATKKPYAIDYTEDAIKQDLKAIYKYISLFQPEKNDIGAAVVVLMYHYHLDTSNAILKAADFPTLSKERFTYLSTLLHAIRSLDEFESVGIEQYRILACGDQRTCDKCTKMNGKQYPVSKAIIGENLPPFCDQCRCIIRPIFK